MRKTFVTLCLFLFPLFIFSQTLNLKVMTFNIRYNNPSDGPYAWEVRKPMVINVIQKENPEIFCCQEVLYDQLSDLTKVFPGYEWYGVGRDDGNRAGEFAPLFWNIDRFNLKAKGTFWLSETPNTPGTKSWDAACNRIVSWVKLKDRLFKKNIYIFNTHFDHQSKQARSESASLLLSAIQQIAGEEWVIVCGDFNDTEGSPMYRILTGSAMNITLINTARICRQEPAGPDYTFIGFPFKPEKGNTIDFIFTRNNKSATVTVHRVITDNIDGRYPSDHLPVIVNFELTIKKRKHVF